MRNKIFLLPLFAMLAFTAVGCGDDETDEPPSRVLDGTAWKLVGIVDVETGSLRELEPKDCDRCYTLEFVAETIIGPLVVTFTSINDGQGAYYVDYKEHVIHITDLIRTLVFEDGDGKLWWDIWKGSNSFSFSLQENELTLYYGEGKSYLLFEPLATITKNYYVYSVNRDETCGYLLFEDTGNPGHYHGSFVWAEELSENYREYLLPVTVTFRYAGKRCNEYPIINIINITKDNEL